MFAQWSIFPPWLSPNHSPPPLPLDRKSLPEPSVAPSGRAAGTNVYPAGYGYGDPSQDDQGIAVEPEFGAVPPPNACSGLLRWGRVDEPEHVCVSRAWYFIIVCTPIGSRAQLFGATQSHGQFPCLSRNAPMRRPCTMRRRTKDTARSRTNPSTPKSLVLASWSTPQRCNRENICMIPASPSHRTYLNGKDCSTSWTTVARRTLQGRIHDDFYGRGPFSRGFRGQRAPPSWWRWARRIFFPIWKMRQHQPSVLIL